MPGSMPSSLIPPVLAEAWRNIFDLVVKTYAAVGFADEWRKHHQGGACGYEPREYLAVPESPDRVALGEEYAWNPSITGYKSEDDACG